MKTSSFLARAILMLAAVALLTLAAGCQSTHPSGPSKPAPLKDGKDYKSVTSTSNGPHPNR